jgi:ABC-type dipeptide/oligopeptide/nickel transport system permease subunit
VVEVARARPLEEAQVREGLRAGVPMRLFLLVLRNPLGLAGLILVLTLVVVGSLAPLIAPYGENEAAGIPFLGPTWGHLFGTDKFGRDILSRVIFGARISLAVGFLSVIGGTAAGTTIGIVSGYFGGWADNLIQRAGDTVMAFPGLILLLIIISVLGPSIDNVVIVIGVGIVPGVSRVVRGAVLAEKQNQYIEAAQARSVLPRILFRHLAPNVMPWPLS